MIFVDAGAWIAQAYTADQHHVAALRWLRQNQQPLLTTDYIIDEALTVLKAQGEPRRAFELGASLFSGSVADIYYLTEEDIQRAWHVFRQYTDKEWSFTDCTSRVVMKELGITHSPSISISASSAP